MAVEKNLQSVKILYELKQYNESLKMALNLYAADNDSDEAKELLVIAAKSLLFLTPSPLSEKEITNFINIASKACDHATNVDDVIDIEVEILNAFAEWHLEVLKRALEFIEEKLDKDVYLQYLELKAKFIPLEAILKISIRNCEIIKKYCEENNITPNEFEKNFDLAKRLPEDLTDEKIGEYEYQTAINIYEKAKATLETNAHGNPDFLVNLVRFILNALMIAELLIKESIPKDGFTTGIKCERMLTKAVILSYKITAKVYPNGKTVYIWPEDSRSKVLDEINAIRLEAKNYELNSEKLESQKDDLIKKIKDYQVQLESVDAEEEQKQWERNYARIAAEYEEKIKQENLNHERIFEQIKQDIITKENKKSEENKTKLKEIEEKTKALRQKKSKLGFFDMSAKKEIDNELAHLDYNYKLLKEEKLLSQDEIKVKYESAQKEQYKKHLQNIEEIKARYSVPMSPKEKAMKRDRYKNGNGQDQMKYKILLILDCAEKLTIKQIATLLEEGFDEIESNAKITALCKMLIEDGLVEREQGTSEFEYWAKK